MRSLRMFLGITTLMLILLPVSSSALLFCGYNGENGLGLFQGSLSYILMKDSAVLQIKLTNTSPVNMGGYITGLAFNNPMGYITGVSYFDPSFDMLGGPVYSDGIDGKPLGYFDIGAGVGGSWMGDGDPKSGIGVGQTKNFIFNLTGTNLALLDENSFLNELSHGGSPKLGGQFIGVHFRSFDNGSNDKVPAYPYPDPMPEPTTIILLGTGFVGIGAWGWMRHRKR